MIDAIADATWRNPLFMLILFGAIWVVPGLIIRRYSEAKALKKKEELQISKIAKLYPKTEDKK